MVHQYDYFINFSYDESVHEYFVDEIIFENFLDKNNLDTNRKILYKYGSYLGNK